MMTDDDRPRCEYCGIEHPPAFHLPGRKVQGDAPPPPAECRPVDPGTFPASSGRARKGRKRHR